MFTMIQATKHTHRSVIKLANGSYVAPSGNVVGEYRVVFPKLTRDAALRVLAGLFQKGEPISLWWEGANEDIAAHIKVAE